MPLSKINIYALLSIPPSSSFTSLKFDSSSKFVTSPIPPFSFNPLLFAGFRIVVSSYIFITLLFTLIWNGVRDGGAESYFSYFTYLTFTGLCAYYIAASVQTASYALRGRRGSSGYAMQDVWREWSIRGWKPGELLQALHVVLHGSIVTFPIVVTIVFWALLANPAVFGTTFSSYSNISIHALNSLFALVEIFLTNSPPPPWIVLPLLILILCGYLGVAYITHATQGFYVYPFLDPVKQGAFLAAYIIGICLGQCIVFVIIRYIMILRERIAIKYGKVPHSITTNGVEMQREATQEWEEIESPNVNKSVASSPIEGISRNDIEKKEEKEEV